MTYASMQIVCKQYCYCCCCCTIWASLWMEHSKICLWFIWILDATIMCECGCFVYNAAAFINTIHSQILIGTFNSNPIWWPAQSMHTTQHSTRKRRSTNGNKPNKKKSTESVRLFKFPMWINKNRYKAHYVTLNALFRISCDAELLELYVWIAGNFVLFENAIRILTNAAKKWLCLLGGDQQHKQTLS